MLYNRCAGIYKFGNNTYPRRIRRRSNLGHVFLGRKCVLWVGKYGIRNYVLMFYLYVNKYVSLKQPFVETFFHFKLPNVACFQRKIQLSGFPAYPDGSSSQLILISEVLLYKKPPRPDITDSSVFLYGSTDIMFIFNYSCF